MIEIPRHNATAASLAELGMVGAAALIVMALGGAIAGEGPLAAQLVPWFANVAMLAVIWVTLRWRGEPWARLGIGFRAAERAPALRSLWQSVAVCLAALAGFVFGSIVATMLLGDQASGDLSGYNYLQGNLPMLMLALPAVWFASSFGEEVVYRGFLMTRVAVMAGGGRRGMSLAVVASALVFGLVHFGWGLYGMVQTAFMGLALAVAFLLVGRNLWALVLAHAYLDTLLLVQLYLGPGT